MPVGQPTSYHGKSRELQAAPIAHGPLADQNEVRGPLADQTEQSKHTWGNGVRRQLPSFPWFLAYVCDEAVGYFCSASAVTASNCSRRKGFGRTAMAPLGSGCFSMSKVPLI